MAIRIARRTTSLRRPTNISLPVATVAAAKELGINLSQACEAGLDAAVREEQARRWKDENREAIESWNRWTGKNGLPLAKYRMF